jgi:hypothetical protein
MHGGEIFIPIIALLGFFGTIITFIYMRYKSRHQQRMALIDSGRSADIFFEKKLDDKSNALKYGMLLTGIGLGFFIGVLIESALDWPEALAVFPMSVIGGGLGLIIFYFLIAKRTESNDYSAL